jgi:hypothetical protein
MIPRLATERVPRRRAPARTNLVAEHTRDRYKPVARPRDVARARAFSALGRAAIEIVSRAADVRAGRDLSDRAPANAPHTLRPEPGERVRNDQDRNGNPDLARDPEDARTAENGTRWPPVPDGVTVAAGVDLDTEDPALVDQPVRAGHPNGLTSRRRCVALRRDGERCGGRAMQSELLCPLHGQRMTAEQGAKAKWTRRRERDRAAESVLQLQRLGTRAVVAEALVAEAANVDKAVRLLCESAGAGDLAAAKALIPWLNQALGMPTERVEHRLPAGLEETRADGRGAAGAAGRGGAPTAAATGRGERDAESGWPALEPNLGRDSRAAGASHPRERGVAMP